MSLGRPKAEATIELENLFETNIDLLTDSDGKLLPPLDEIWSILNNKCSVKKTNKAVYTAALKWHRNKNNSKVNDNDIDEENDADVSVETSFDTSSDANLDTSDDAKKSAKKSVKKITIQLSSKVWRTIAPKEITYKRKREGSHKTGVRKYLSLEPGLWSNIFANEIAKHDEIPCNWIFKRNKCYLSGNKFFDFEAKCNTCSAVLVGSLKKKPEEDESVNIHIQVYDIGLESHTKETKKVKLTSKAAAKIYSQNKTATAIRRNLLKNSTNMFTAPTSRVMTANAIRCAQYRQRKNEKLSQCPIEALEYMMESNLYMNCIQRLGNKPFYVFYCTPEQMKLFHAFRNKNKSFKVSCDATGGLVHKIGNVTLLLCFFCIEKFLY